MLAWALRRSCRPAWAQRRRAIGKMLLTGAAAERLTGRYAVAKLLAGAPQWQRCCWPGRCGRAAGRPVRSGKEAGRGTAMVKRQAGNAVVAKRLLAGAPWQSRRRRRGMAVARERHSRLARERRGRLAGNAATDWHENARNAKEPAPTDGTGPSQTFGCIQAEQSLVEDFVCLFLLGMRIYI